ncbi:xanthine dehydrogenase accessory protein XdhC [Paracoccus nototheniae]|uniref:Xanthine dehydrogenase accessory protein XdhC n=1 Tax=Paracoccus nototheniae TaxID=2489002 RepID=A0ABW4DWM2_9RHOB|nr:xanthine dehydrogenase accessory protein XdhC [Paracoccus nototheniae]
MIRVRVTAAKGSTPREAGAWMIVTPDATQGTIGGGQLEYMAIDRARQMLARGEAEARMEIPLGPEIGQCCGGRVTLMLDRHAPDSPNQPRALIFGAGHVGRALARALEPLPLDATLIDSRAGELALASGPTLLTPLPEAQIREAAPGTVVVIVTHDHALDFLLAAEALARSDLPYVGMIGSATKRAQFSRFAAARGIDPAPLICPIGAGFSRDKRPELIAAFTAAEVMAHLTHFSARTSACNS